jgi:hypothetical protein
MKHRIHKSKDKNKGKIEEREKEVKRNQERRKQIIN